MVHAPGVTIVVQGTHAFRGDVSVTVTAATPGKSAANALNGQYARYSHPQAGRCADERRDLGLDGSCLPGARLKPSEIASELL